jgi:hypothetical protein
MPKIKTPRYVRVLFNTARTNHLKNKTVADVDIVDILPFDQLRGDFYTQATRCPVEELPAWMQERLAALLLVEPKDGTVAGVGKRITQSIFWVEVNDTGS